ALLGLGNVGMILAREFAKGLFDVVVAGRARHTEDLVIIFELDGHKTKGRLRQEQDESASQNMHANRRKSKRGGPPVRSSRFTLVRDSKSNICPVPPGRKSKIISGFIQ